MYSFSDNYYNRKCYFKTQQVPTQSVMKKIMKPPLARVYFKSMNSNLKVLAGLEPPLKGGGANWFMPPDELLACKSVLKPVSKDILKKLTYNGIYLFETTILKMHYRSLRKELFQTLLENDLKWKEKIKESNAHSEEIFAKREAHHNTRKIRDTLQEFETIHRTATTNVEAIVFNAAINEIRNIKAKAYQKMKTKFEALVKQQAVTLYNEYSEMLKREKEAIKGDFINKVDTIRSDMMAELHDINVEKHLAIEKLRNYLECQNLACQVYVALKEKEECKKELDSVKYEHAKTIKEMNTVITLKNLDIVHEISEEKKREELNLIWKKKICHVVKKFQLFVEYCLKMLPDHAEFFVNMEKLMMLQLNEAVNNPSVESIIESSEGVPFPGLVPKPHPFYLCCDRGFKTKIKPDYNLCLKHVSSDASQMPVIIVNGKFLYAACDNFEKYSDKIYEYICGHRGDDTDFVDDNSTYSFKVPVKYTSEMRLKELKLESSLLQLLQQEVPNVKNVTVELCTCKAPQCVCSPSHTPVVSMPPTPDAEEPPPAAKDKLIEPRSEELKVHREPKWESYMEYVLPERCKCAKRAKKHLNEHLPPYMKNMSKYDVPDLPNYSPCNLIELRRAVAEAKRRAQRVPAIYTEETVVSHTRDVGTQWLDQEYEALCKCFSDMELEKILEAAKKELKALQKGNEQEIVVKGSMSSASLCKTASTFATKRALSLRKLLAEKPELEEIFVKKNCDYS